MGPHINFTSLSGSELCPEIILNSNQENGPTV